jgi:hypothetical protein
MSLARVVAYISSKTAGTRVKGRKPIEAKADRKLVRVVLNRYGR